jgi:hypothetical protein
MNEKGESNDVQGIGKRVKTEARGWVVGWVGGREKERKRKKQETGARAAISIYTRQWPCLHVAHYGAQHVCMIQ